MVSHFAKLNACQSYPLYGVRSDRELHDDVINMHWLYYYIIHINPCRNHGALNITAIVGNKGQSHPYSCMDNSDGTNVLSVTFHPQQQTLVIKS